MIEQKVEGGQRSVPFDQITKVSSNQESLPEYSESKSDVLGYFTL